MEYNALTAVALQPDYILQIPTDVIRMIFSLLRPRDFMRFAQTCKKLYNMLSFDDIYNVMKVLSVPADSIYYVTETLSGPIDSISLCQRDIKQPRCSSEYCPDDYCDCDFCITGNRPVCIDYGDDTEPCNACPGCVNRFLPNGSPFIVLEKHADSLSRGFHYDWTTTYGPRGTRWTVAKPCDCYKRSMDWISGKNRTVPGIASRYIEWDGHGYKLGQITLYAGRDARKETIRYFRDLTVTRIEGASYTCEIKADDYMETVTKEMYDDEDRRTTQEIHREYFESGGFRMTIHTVRAEIDGDIVADEEYVDDYLVRSTRYVHNGIVSAGELYGLALSMKGMLDEDFCIDSLFTDSPSDDALHKNAVL